MLRVGDQDHLGAPWADVQRLTQQAFLIQDRLALENPVAGTAVQQDPLAQAVELDSDDLRDLPAVRDRRQGLLESAQLGVLLLECLEAHAAQLDLALLRTQAIVFTL